MRPAILGGTQFHTGDARLMNSSHIIWAGILVYIPFFYLMCWRRPDRALLTIFASAPFQNEVSGPLPVKFSLAEVNLLLALPILLFRARKLHFGATFPASLLYYMVCLACTIPQWRSTSLVSLVQITVYLFAAVLLFASLPQTTREYLPALKGLVWVCGFVAFVMLLRRSGNVFGLNKNGLGGSLAATLLIAIELFAASEGRREKTIYGCLLGLISGGLLLTLSRGAWLGAIAGVITLFMVRRQFGRLIKAAALLTPLLAIGWILLPEEARDYATGFSQERFNIKLRYESMQFALDKFRANPMMGSGVGLRKEYDATNVALMTLAETGVPGLCTFLFIPLVLAGMVWRAQRGLSKESFEFSVLAIASGLAVGKLAHGMVDHYWSRGSLMVAWAAVGMATRVAATRRIAGNDFRAPHLPAPREQTALQPAIA